MIRMIKIHTTQDTVGRVLWQGAGDRFHPIILTPYGGWWRWGNNSEHNDFLANVAHSGDAAPDYDIEAPRFDHHGRTWA